MPYLPRTDGKSCGWARQSGHNCPGDPIHVIGSHKPDGEFVQLALCHDHFLIAIEAGLISDPFIGEEKFKGLGGIPKS